MRLSFLMRNLLATVQAHGFSRPSGSKYQVVAFCFLFSSRDTTKVTVFKRASGDESVLGKTASACDKGNR